MMENSTVCPHGWGKRHPRTIFKMPSKTVLDRSEPQVVHKKIAWMVWQRKELFFPNLKFKLSMTNFHGFLLGEGENHLNSKW